MIYVFWSANVVLRSQKSNEKHMRSHFRSIKTIAFVTSTIPPYC